MAVTSCWKHILLNVAGALKGDAGVDSIKPPCVRGAWGSRADGAGNSNVPQVPVHSALYSGLVFLFFSPWGMVGLLNVT